MEVKSLKRSFWQRLFGIPETRMPGDAGCWTYADGKLVIDLGRTPELSRPGSAIRLEGKGLPDRILVVFGDDSQYHVFRNRCKHMGRRLDPVPATSTVQCCSVGKTTYTYDGTVLQGPAKGPVETFVVQREGERLIVTL